MGGSQISDLIEIVEQRASHEAILVGFWLVETKRETYG